MDRKNSAGPHLLDRLAQASGCIQPSELRAVDAVRRKALLEHLSPEDAPLREWNEVLRYLSGAPLEMTAERARARLLDELRHGEGEIF